MNEIEKFKNIVAENIVNMGKDEQFKEQSIQWLIDSGKYNYSYNYSWMGRPIIQYPQDMIAMQEIIWNIKPDVIIETGIAHGGSLIFYASILELIGKGNVIGIDIDIRVHNRAEIEKHPMAKRITMIEGSSIDLNTIDKVKSEIKPDQVVMVLLDSNHTYEHVMEEIRLYSGFVSKNSYLVVFDTSVEYMPEDYYPERPWGKGNNPMTAVDELLKSTDEFEIDNMVCDKLGITVAPRGYLKRIR